MSVAILGALAAAVASLIYNAGVALQALEARATPVRHAWRAGLIARLARRRRWLAGTVLSIAGWPLHAAALLLAPLSVVQPALAVGLVWLLGAGARRLGERVTAADVVAVAAIAGGVVALAAGAPAPVLHASQRPAAIALAGLAAVIVCLWAVARGRPGAVACGPLAAGLCFAWSGLCTQLAVDAAHRGAWPVAAVWVAATATASGLGLVAEMTALQRLPAVRVAPTVFVVQVVVPVALSPAIAPGSLAHGLAAAWMDAAGLVAVVSAAASLLLRSPAVRALVDDASSADTVCTATPSARARRHIATSERVAPAPDTLTSTIPPVGSGACDPAVSSTRSGASA
jgi:hypothetical protein